MQRVFAFPLIRLFLIVLLFGGLAAPIVIAFHPLAASWAGIALSWILAALLFAAIVIVERLSTGRSPSAIGFDVRRAPRDLLAGAVFGGLLFSMVVFELWLLGFYRVAAVHPSWDLALAALLLLPGAALEELLFRGVLFRLVEEWSGSWVALAVSAAVFGLVHAANPGATWISTLAIALEAGVLLAAAYVLTRNLWFPIALHFAWNFFEGPVFGAQVSGHVFLTSFTVARISGPAIVTGGSFGPEAGLPAIVTCLIAAIALLIVATLRGRIVGRAMLVRHVIDGLQRVIE
jgi:uncharacterized protein